MISIIFVLVISIVVFFLFKLFDDNEFKDLDLEEILEVNLFDLKNNYF